MDVDITSWEERAKNEGYCDMELHCSLCVAVSFKTPQIESVGYQVFLFLL